MNLSVSQRRSNGQFEKGFMVDPMQRFMSYVQKTESCWIWTGGFNAYGYGYFRLSRQLGVGNKAHHASLFLLRGKRVPLGMTVDHLCFTPACVNPDHLEIASNRENIRRAAARKTHCPNGHPYPDMIVRNRGKRRCKICQREKWYKWFSKRTNKTNSITKCDLCKRSCIRRKPLHGGFMVCRECFYGEAK